MKSSVVRFLLTGFAGTALTAIALLPAFRSLIGDQTPHAMFGAVILFAVLGMTALPIGFFVSSVSPRSKSKLDDVLLELAGTFLLSTLIALVFVDPLLMLFGCLLVPVFICFGHVGHRTGFLADTNVKIQERSTSFRDEAQFVGSVATNSTRVTGRVCFRQKKMSRAESVARELMTFERVGDGYNIGLPIDWNLRSKSSRLRGTNLIECEQVVQDGDREESSG
jgi:hypothetical protein